MPKKKLSPADLNSKEKCFKDKLFLIEINEPEDDSLVQKEFLIEGTTGNVYTVTMKKQPKCTCPDYTMRKHRCKHIFFVLIRILKADNSEKMNYKDEELLEMLDNMPKVTRHLKAKKKDRDLYKEIMKEKNSKFAQVEQKKLTNNDDCPICLEKLLNGEKLDYCKYFCGNSIHKKCFEMWKKTKKEPVCVYCRGNWNGEKKRFKRRGRYINLQRDGLEHQGEEELEYDDLGDFIVEDDNYMDYLEDENYLI